MSEVSFLRQWTITVRRARLGRTNKVVALALATYADSDGTRVHPGVARLSYECEISYTTVKTALRTLRGMGLIEKVGRVGDADDYRLIFHEDVLERVMVPTPAEVAVALKNIRAKYRGNYSPSLRTPTQTAEIDDDDDLRSAPRTADTQTCGRLDDPQNESADAYSNTLRSAPRTATYQDRDTTDTAHPDEEVRTDITVPSDPPPNEDPISPPADLASRPRCPHGKSKRRDGDVPRCPDCRTEMERMVAESLRVQLGPAKCDAHKRPIGQCHFCRRGLPGAKA